MQENDNLVQLQDENGKDVNFEHLMTIEHEGNYYVVLEATEDTKLLEFSLDSFVILAHVAAYFNLTVGAGAGGEA